MVSPPSVQAPLRPPSGPVAMFALFLNAVRTIAAGEVPLAEPIATSKVRSVAERAAGGGGQLAYAPPVAGNPPTTLAPQVVRRIEAMINAQPIVSEAQVQAMADAVTYEHNLSPEQAQQVYTRFQAELRATADGRFPELAGAA